VKTSHAVRIRNSIWLGLGLLALAHVQVAHAVDWKNTSDYLWTGSGNVREVNVGAGSGSTILDYKGTPTGATIGKTTPLGIGGHQVPVTAIAKVAAPSLGKAIARFAAGVVPVVAAGIATAQLLNDINVIMRTPQGGGPNQFFEVIKGEGNGWEYYYNVWTYKTPSAACNDYLSRNAAADPDAHWSSVTTEVAGDGSSVRCTITGKYNGSTLTSVGNFPGRRVPITDAREQEITLDDLATKIARESGWPDPQRLGNILREAINSGQTVDVGTPTVTGPASSQGTPVTKTTTNPQGQSITTTTNTTNNYNYEGNKVTNTPTTITTTVNNNTGEKKEETETTDDKRTECQKNPESLSCATTDVPDGEIPKSSKTVTYSEDGFLSGGGTCPADKYASIHGVSTKVWDWQQACGYISGPIRAVVLVLAALSAAFILIPGKGGDGP